MLISGETKNFRMTNLMKINKFTVDYESINLPNTKSRYHEIIYMYQINPQQAYFRQNKNFQEILGKRGSK